jgi:hypothetical protein
VTTAGLAPVIPLRPDRMTEPVIPQPARLYCLTVLAFLLHKPGAGECVRCGQPWPCQQARLAYRLREGF